MKVTFFFPIQTTTLVFLILFSSQIIAAQRFQLVADYPFEALETSTVDFIDVDGDGDKDLLITGENSSRVAITKLYRNNGLGKFTEVLNTPFEGIEDGDVAYADIDGDEDYDLLFTGDNNSRDLVVNLYVNDGSGNFTAVDETPFEPVLRGAVAFADVDGDLDQDVVIAGNIQGNGSTKLYLNDGSGKFSLANVFLPGVSDGASIALADVDGDKDQDLFISGFGVSHTRLLYNDGTGNFTDSGSNVFTSVRNGAIAIGDIDGDMDLDVFLTGANPENSYISKLYRNNGIGNYAEISSVMFRRVGFSAAAFLDADNDKDQDIILTGQGGIYAQDLYLNNGKGNYTLKANTPFQGVQQGAIGIDDIDGDNDEDILISGLTQQGKLISKIYTNEGQGDFKEAKPLLAHVKNSAIAYADIDGDEDRDVLITGEDIDGEALSKLYRNDGLGNFTEIPDLPLEAVTFGAVAFADVDGDKDQDILITGTQGKGLNKSYVTKLYLNDGSGFYTEKENTAFEAVGSGAVAFLDIDNDQDLDVFINGEYTSFFGRAKLYRNDGRGNFTEIPDTPFKGLYDCVVAYGDMDGNMANDIIVMGTDNGFFGETHLYLNDGNGKFTEDTNTPFDRVYGSDLKIGDIDNDQDLDLIIVGNNRLPEIQIYFNSGKAQFSKQSTPLERVGNGSVALADIDKDQDLDIVISGENESSDFVSKVYTNDGEGEFTRLSYQTFSGLTFGSIALTDFDGDQYPDLLLTGELPSGSPMSQLYINEALVSSISNEVHPNKAGFQIFPNPSKGGNFSLKYYSKQRQTFHAQLLDLNGKVMYQENIQVFPGEQTISMQLPLLADGLYFIRMMGNNGFSEVLKVVIQY